MMLSKPFFRPDGDWARITSATPRGLEDWCWPLQPRWGIPSKAVQNSMVQQVCRKSGSLSGQTNDDKEMMHWLWTPPSNNGKWTFIGIPYQTCNTPAGHYYWEVAPANLRNHILPRNVSTGPGDRERLEVHSRVSSPATAAYACFIETSLLGVEPAASPICILNQT